MTTTDPISDMLTRIRNAIGARQSEVTMPHSKIKESVAKLLRVNNFIDDVEVKPGIVGKQLKIVINHAGTNPRITEIERISKPGRRDYRGFDKIPVIKRGRGLIVVSTSKGLMTDAEARAQKTGGELICKVY